MKTLSEKKRKENVITQLYAVKNGYEKAIEEVFKAYPLDIFPDTTQAERDPIIEKYPGFIDRTSAMMGRHIAKVVLERAMYFAREILEDGEAAEHTLDFEPCNFCVNEHIKNEIRKERIAQLAKIECPKCKGTGYSAVEQFIKGFMCGECGGAGWIRHA